MSEERRDYQLRVHAWMLACFGDDITANGDERVFRFIEEALELAQSRGCSAEDAHKLVDYVFGRPVGDAAQEVGGVMVTLAALCTAAGIDLDAQAEAELSRVWSMIEKIRLKHQNKPKSVRTALPGDEA